MSETKGPGHAQGSGPGAGFMTEHTGGLAPPATSSASTNSRRYPLDAPPDGTVQPVPAHESLFPPEHPSSHELPPSDTIHRGALVHASSYTAGYPASRNAPPYVVPRPAEGVTRSYDHVPEPDLRTLSVPAPSGSRYRPSSDSAGSSSGPDALESDVDLYRETAWAETRPPSPTRPAGLRAAFFQLRRRTGGDELVTPHGRVAVDPDPAPLYRPRKIGRKRPNALPPPSSDRSDGDEKATSPGPPAGVPEAEVEYRSRAVPVRRRRPGAAPSPFPSSGRTEAGPRTRARGAAGEDVTVESGAAPFLPPVARAVARGDRIVVPYGSLHEHWADLLAHCKETDGEMFRNWDEEINALLVFSGLFSAVLTAFVIESYQLLKLDDERTSADVLMTISEQLQALARGDGAAASSYTNGPGRGDPRRESTSAVVLNALWFIALVAAVLSAFFGILLKQALREYNSWSSVAGPIAALELRQLRFVALSHWKVSAVMASLPALLELSVVLFMAGLPIFLFNPSPTLGALFIVISGIFLAICAVVTAVPALVDDFPYKNPVAWSFHRLVSGFRHLYRTLWGQLQAVWSAPKPKNREIHSLGRPHSVPEKRASPRTNVIFEGATWRERDLLKARHEERKHLWSLMRWFCGSGTEHLYELGKPVKAAVQDLIYGSISQPRRTYVDVLNALPYMLQFEQPDSIWPALLDLCGVRQSLGSYFSQGDGDQDAKLHLKAKLHESISEAPWRLLAIFNDELTGTIQDALKRFEKPRGVEDRRFVPTPSKIHADRRLLVLAFYLLECLFEPARVARVEMAFTKNWLVLVLSACSHDVFIPVGERPEGELLPNLLVSWMPERQLPQYGPDAVRRMLKSIKDIDRGDDDAKAHWTATRLRFISIVMPRALSAAIEFSGADEYPRLNALIPHACRVTADAVDFSHRQGTIEEFFPAGFRANLLRTFETRAFSSGGDVDPSYQLKALLTDGVSDSPVRVIVMQPSFEDPRAVRRTPGSATARESSEGFRQTVRAADDPHSRPPNSVDYAPGRDESPVGGLGNLELNDVSGAAGPAAPDLATHHAGISSSGPEPQEQQDGGERDGEDTDDDDDDDKAMDETEQQRQPSSGGSGRGLGRGGRRRARGRAHRLGHAGRFESDPGSTEESRSSSRPR